MYSFNIFTKAGIAPLANAVVYGIKAGLLPTSSVRDFEEYMMANWSAEGSYDLLAFEGSADEALKALSDAGYEDDGQGSRFLMFFALLRWRAWSQVDKTCSLRSRESMLTSGTRAIWSPSSTTCRATKANHLKKL